MMQRTIVILLAGAAVCSSCGPARLAPSRQPAPLPAAQAAPARDFVREADQRIAALTAELASVEAALTDRNLPADACGELERELARLRAEIAQATAGGQKRSPSAMAVAAANVGQAVRSKAPELVVRLPGGATGSREFDLSKQSERPVIIQFFAEWSGPCKKTLPELARLSKDLEGRADVVLIRFMSNDERKGAQSVRGQELALQASRALLASIGASALDDQVAVDADGSMASRWGVKAVPAIYLVAPDGSVAQSWQGVGADTYSEIRRIIDDLNPNPAAAPAAPAAPPAPQLRTP
jgi:thiol-disulfide isomerase/thioredoxin